MTDDRKDPLEPSQPEGPGSTGEKLGDMGKGSFEQSQDGKGPPPQTPPSR